MSEKIIKSVLGGGNLEEENRILREQVELLRAENEELKDERRQKKGDVPIFDYTVSNLFRFFKTQDYKLIHPELYEYDDELTSFEKNSKIERYYRDYQRDFIKKWSLSSQELVFLYYGVGSGKTLIAVNCAEQFVALNENSFVYFLTPASLVLNTIKEMYQRGIDASRKNKDGEYIYYFVSYQQLLRSDFIFKDNSLLIIDEAHNLRNFKTKTISEKVSARKYLKTDNYSIVGNKLSLKLLESSNSFVRSIFLSGTLFVNGPEDIESIISIGYKKKPLLDANLTEYLTIQTDKKLFQQYYDGLMSYYRIPDDAPEFPRKKYHIELIQSQTKSYERGKDAYYVNSRRDSAIDKIKWITEFLASHINEKTLIYSQFLSKSLEDLMEVLDSNKIKYGVITGNDNITQKMEIVRQYNDNEIKILLFTLAIKEGISFKETNNFIAIDPYWNYAIFEQVLARGIRLNSHHLGRKSTINIYLLVGVPDTENEIIKKWEKEADYIFNNDIKTFIEPVDEDGKIKNPKLPDINVRDIYMYNKMLNKQEKINVFEIKLKDVKKFEDSITIENNEFVQECELYFIKEEKKGVKLSKAEKNTIKKKLYKEYQQKQIELINKKFPKFSEDSLYKSSRNPEFNKIINSNKGDEEKIKELINKNASLDEIFTIFKIDKQILTQYQAFFTPPEICKELVKFSKIEDDKRDKIFILEPTAGIGNIITEVLKCNNKQNYFIDCNELNDVFYTIGKSIFSDIENLMYYNMDFIIYRQKYNYDYILGNPPFNLKTKINIVVKGKIEKVDATLYDIDFIGYAYELLNRDGFLVYIISDRFLRDTSSRFEKFRKQLELLKKNVQIEEIGEFKQTDKTKTAKLQETKQKMVMIKIKKIDGFSFKEKETKTSIARKKKEIEIIVDVKEQPPKAKPRRRKQDLKKTNDIDFLEL